MKLIPTPREPDIEQYTCSASIDYVKVFHPTHVGLPFDSKQGNILCDLGQGRFTTIHDLSPKDFEAACPLLGDARIIELEVSLDFRVRGMHDHDERERMLHEIGNWLMKHWYPWSAPGIQEGHRVSRCRGMAEKVVRPSGDITPARIGDTLYLGHADSRYANPDEPNFASMRFYVKQTDDGQVLRPRRWSARLEVTLTREGCEHFGLRTLNDLRGFNFRMLNPYFKMVRPSFALGAPKHGRTINARLQSAIDAWVERFLAERVNDAGAWSLDGIPLATPLNKRHADANRRIGVTLNNLSVRFGRGRMRSAGAPVRHPTGVSASHRRAAPRKVRTNHAKRIKSAVTDVVHVATKPNTFNDHGAREK